MVRTSLISGFNRVLCLLLNGGRFTFRLDQAAYCAWNYEISPSARHVFVLEIILRETKKNAFENSTGLKDLRISSTKSSGQSDNAPCQILW